LERLTPFYASLPPQSWLLLHRGRLLVLLTVHEELARLSSKRCLPRCAVCIHLISFVVLIAASQWLMIFLLLVWRTALCAQEVAVHAEASFRPGLSDRRVRSTSWWWRVRAKAFAKTQAWVGRLFTRRSGVHLCMHGSADGNRRVLEATAKVQAVRSLHTMRRGDGWSLLHVRDRYVGRPPPKLL
jgi:hypothetical protein